MILLFTSKDCTWCDLLKDMILEEAGVFGGDSVVYEIDVDRYARIAKAYGIMTVPTMVARSSTLSGVPEPDDLRSFMFRALSERTADFGEPASVIDHALLLRKAELTSAEHIAVSIEQESNTAEDSSRAMFPPPLSEKSKKEPTPRAS